MSFQARPGYLKGKVDMLHNHFFRVGSHNHLLPNNLERKAEPHDRAVKPQAVIVPEENTGAGFFPHMAAFQTQSPRAVSSLG